MSTPVHETSNSYKANLSASANVCASACHLARIFVSAASATPTITIYDDSGTGTTVPLITVFTPVAGTMYEFKVRCANGIYVVISGTVNCCVIFDTNTSA